MLGLTQSPIAEGADGGLSRIAARRHHCLGPGPQHGLEHHHTVFALDGGMLFGLHAHTAGNSGDQADETRTGLDHVGFALTGSAELEQWRQRLDELGIAHGGIKKAHYGSGISFRDPDNIGLEFFIAPGT
jgi:glyoxylase I family protein